MRITATLLADFFQCPYKAVFSAALKNSALKDSTPLSQMITAAGNSYEEEVISAYDYVRIDSSPGNYQKACVDTLQAIKRGVSAIHHGIFFRNENGVEYVCEPDLLIRDNPQSEIPSYTILEIKHSREMKTTHVMQVMFNIDMMDFCAPSHISKTENHAVLIKNKIKKKIQFDEYRYVYHLHCKKLISILVNSDCIEQAQSGGFPEHNELSFSVSYQCLYCPWKTECHSRALRAGLPGTIYGLSGKELGVFSMGMSGVIRLRDIAEKDISDSPLRVMEQHRRGIIAGQRMKNIQKQAAVLLNKKNEPLVLPEKINPPRFVLVIHTDPVQQKDIFAWTIGDSHTGKISVFAGNEKDELTNTLIEKISSILSSGIIAADSISLDFFREHILLSAGFAAYAADNTSGNPMFSNFLSLESLTAETHALPLTHYNLPDILAHLGYISDKNDEPVLYYHKGSDFIRKATEWMQAALKLYSALVRNNAADAGFTPSGGRAAVFKSFTQKSVKLSVAASRGDTVTLADIEQFLNKELVQAKSDLIANYGLRADQRVENHSCISDASVISSAAGRIALTCAENSARFREGDTVILNRTGTPPQQLQDGYQMDFSGYDPVKKIILLERTWSNRAVPIPFIPGDQVCIDSTPDELPSVLKKIIVNLWKNGNKNKFFSDFLNGKLERSIEEKDDELSSRICTAAGLNADQCHAFNTAVTHSPAAAIHGPPGTGKTRLLAAVAAYYLEKNTSVTVCAVSHFAINNALNKISELLQKINSTAKVIKVSKNKNSGLRKEIIRVSRLRDVTSSGPYAAGMTVFKMPYEITQGTVPILLLDEASQAAVPFGLAAAGYAEKTVLFGDHFQLEPIINYRNHPGKLCSSIFAQFMEMYPERTAMLTGTYRMSAALLAAPSRIFYQNKLISLKTTSNQLESNNPQSGSVGLQSGRASPQLKSDSGNLLQSEIQLPANPSSLILVPHYYCGKFSIEEALVCTALVRRAIIHHNIKPEHIAVLVPFRAQQHVIKSMFHFSAIPLTRVLVDTVERMQGQERELVIYSMTASDTDSLRKTGEFFFNPRRFNVAITRASGQRIVIASENLLYTGTDDYKVLSSLNMIADFFTNEHRIYVSPETIAALKQDFTNQFPGHGVF